MQDSLYCTEDDVTTYALDNGGVAWISLLESEQIVRTRLLVKANKEIIRAIGVVNTDGSLVYPNNTDLNKAAILQTIELAEIQDARDSAKQARQLSGGEFSDGVISVNSIPDHYLNEDAQFYVDKFLYEYGDTIEYLRPPQGVGR